LKNNDSRKHTGISLSSVVQASPEHVAANLADEVVILNLQDEIYYGLNPVGARIWNLVQTPRAVQEIQDILVQEYDVEPQRCYADLLELLQKMSAKGLIRIGDGETS
jgi:hypothetical protein